MKFRLFTRRLGVSASKMTVKRHVPLPLRMASLALAVALGAVGAIWTWQTLFGNASAEKQQLSDELIETKTQLAQHKGHVSVQEVTDEGVVLLNFGGGCHGCGMADVTLKQGIEKTLLEQVPGVTAVRDATVQGLRNG